MVALSIVVSLIRYYARPSSRDETNDSQENESSVNLETRFPVLRRHVYYSAHDNVMTTIELINRCDQWRGEFLDFEFFETFTDGNSFSSFSNIFMFVFGCWSFGLLAGSKARGSKREQSKSKHEYNRKTWKRVFRLFFVHNIQIENDLTRAECIKQLSVKRGRKNKNTLQHTEKYGTIIYTYCPKE